MFNKKVFYILLLLIVFTSFSTAYADWVHRVTFGETLGSVAKHYGMTADTLLGNNQYIQDPNKIYYGQVLIIPGPNKQAYRVKSGDTLFSIASQFSIPVQILTSYNRLANPNAIYANQTLLIPKIYTVKAGDTLSNIAVTLGIPINDLMLENNLKDIDNLFVGQVLYIPFETSEKENLAANERTLSAIAGKFPDTFFYKGSTGRKRVALTFDDGPGRPITSNVLDVLKVYNVQATFFLLGSNMPGNGEIVKRAVAEGHTVANHTWSHPNLKNLTWNGLYKEIISQESDIEEVTGLKTALMRPPYGFASEQNLNQLKSMGYKVIKWSVDSKDWDNKDPDKVLINTLTDVRDGSIILMHDYLGHSVTQNALPEIIQSLKYQGYTFVTADKLLGINAYR